MQKTRWLIVVGWLIGSAAYAGGDPIPVCVGSGGTLYLIDMKQKCKAGEERRLFAEWEEEAPEPPDEEEEEEQANEAQKAKEAKNDDEARQAKEDEEKDMMRRQLEQLTKRVAALESDPQNSKAKKASNRITAPFEVVGRSGKVILRVAEKVSSTSGEGAHVTIGAGTSGNYGVRVYKEGGSFVAGVGQATGGTGVVVVVDEGGDLVAAMSARDRSISVYQDNYAAAGIALTQNGGTVAVYQGGQPVAYLTRSSHGNGGNVTLADGKGFGVFSAGSASDGGGEACLNRVTGSGKARNVCLGVELPSMGLGK